MSERYHSAIITDLDGTLTKNDGTIPSEAVTALAALGSAGVLRAVATGRSYHGVKKVLPADFPIDYVIFSSGAGIVEWPSRKMVFVRNLQSDEITVTHKTLHQHQLDYMVHHPIPENHRFRYHTHRDPTGDFQRRCARHEDWCHRLASDELIGEASQFLLVEPKGRAPQSERLLRAALPEMSIIRATSPLDGESTWIEILSKGITKGAAAEWLVQRYRLDSKRCLAVGNDYNDTALLEWAGTSFVVQNAPDDLKALFPIVASSNDGGFVSAISLWQTKFRTIV